MTDRPWKQTERAIARRLGGRRLGPTGRHGPDVTSDWLQAEVKTRKRLPVWLLDALEQAWREWRQEVAREQVLP